jgi:hypothetical protein
VLAQHPNGAPDRSFGPGDSGAFPIPIGNKSAARAIRVLPDGRIIVAGMTELADGISWFVARYLP